MTVGFLVEQSIDVRQVAARVVTPERGGVVTFVGVVRNHHAGRSVVRLEYSAYGPMADAECTRILEEAEGRWPARVAAEHRIGTLEVGDAAVVVVAAAAHRDAAFEACRYVIEELKRRVPIWKREHYADGTAGWVDPTATAGVSF